MSTAALAGGTRSARAGSSASRRNIGVSLIVSGRRQVRKEVPYGSSSARVAEELGVDVQGMSFRRGPDAIEALTPLTTDCDVIVTPDFVSG